LESPVLGSKEGVMSENTLTKALRTLGYTSDVMTWHGFRSMASTVLNEQQCWHPDAIERQLAHAPETKSVPLTTTLSTCPSAAG
jgi:hypothetical protein